ncbi:MAG: hypothetical protein WB770_11050 [Acidimicrobiales bacterium]
MSAIAPDVGCSVDLDETASTILAVQRADGAIPWYRGGRLDPWNHVEAAMALTVSGEIDAARRAFEWLDVHQLENGSWFAAYAEDGSVLEVHTDTNATAYLATGLHLYHLATGDESFTRSMFATVDRALDFVVRFVDDRGMLPWSIGPGGTRSKDSLFAASASVVMSLRCGVALAFALGEQRERWLRAARAIAESVAVRESTFLDKSVFAMDWYYPVLCGVLEPDRACRRLEGSLERFFDPAHGVRCRADGAWVTSAESAECAVAFARAGMDARARRILAVAQGLRAGDGAYRTGVVPPRCSEYPRDERTTYSAAAMILAADVLSGGPSTQIFSPLTGSAA